MADQLTPVPLITPGFKGLNKAQAASTELDTGYGVELQNAVFDQSGRVAARQGWTKLTASAVGSGASLTSQGEYVKADGSVQLVSASATKIYSGTSVLTDVTGAVVPTGGNWQWLNFNNLMYGVQSGNSVIQWNGAGNFAVISPSAGSVPQGACGLAAFGRLWVLGTDGQTVNYCNLLDATAWSGTGAGSFSMATVWTRGTDHVVAIAAAGSKLVVFGEKQIVIFYDQTNPAIGLNPANLAVYDTIEGTGCVARDTVQSTGEGDLTFLSPTGVQSLQRLLSSGKDNPVAPLDPQIHDYFNGYFVNEVAAAVRSAYSPLNRFYVILLPIAGRAFCYDTRVNMPDGTLRASEWNGLTWKSLCNRRDGSVTYGEAGVVGQYSGYLDNLATYQYVYNSPFISLNPQAENRTKILKKFKAVLYFGGNTNFAFYWGVDFQGLPNALQFALSGAITEYGTAEYGTNGKYNVNLPAPTSGVTYAEYGGAAGLTVITGPLSGTGRWMQFGIIATINGAAFAVQQLDTFVKLGSMT